MGNAHAKFGEVWVKIDGVKDKREFLKNTVKIPYIYNTPVR